MQNQPSPPTVKKDASRFFYPIASAALLLLTFIGFQLFYLHGQSFPGRPLTPPIRTLLICHGVLMTLWILLAIAQPFLVAMGRRDIHKRLGIFGAVLAALIVLVGFRLGIAAAQVNPPDLRIFGMVPKQFVAIPLSSIITFGIFVAIGIRYRNRPEIHRPFMLLASLAIVTAAIGRINILNTWYAGTILETVFTAFLATLLIGLVLFAIKCAWTKSFDRWFAAGLGLFAAESIVVSLAAKTPAWESFAAILLR